jgi:hypothetical protein
MMNRESWNGRPVKYVEFSIRTGRGVTEAFRRDGEEGAFALLVQSLRYADDDQPVFASVEEVMDQPFRLRERIADLASKCAVVNGLRQDDPGAEVSTDAQLNGHAEGASAGPSH